MKNINNLHIIYILGLNTENHEYDRFSGKNVKLTIGQIIFVID